MFWYSPKLLPKHLFISLFLQYHWGCLLRISITILDRLYLTLFFVSDTNPCPTYLIIWLKMGSLFPPVGSSSIPLPNGLLAPPTMPSLGDCFPCGSVDLGKYVLYSSALSRRVHWRTSLAMSMCGQGMPPFLIDHNAGNAPVPIVPKTRMQCFCLPVAGPRGWTAGDYSSRGFNVV